MFYFSGGGGVWVPVGVGKIVCQTVLLFDGLPFHPFVCYYTVLCMFLSVCLSTSSSIVCLCVRPSVHVRPCPSVRLYAYFYDIVCYFIGLYVFFRSVRPSYRPSALSSSVCMNACLYVCLFSVYMSVTYLISKLLLLTSYF